MVVLVYSSSGSSSLKMEALRSFETLVSFHQSTWRSILEHLNIPVFIWNRNVRSTSLKGTGQRVLSWTAVLSVFPHPNSWRFIWTLSSHLLLGLPSNLSNNSWKMIVLYRHVTYVVLVEVSFTFCRVDPWHLSPFCTCSVFLPVGLVECNKATVAVVRTARYCSQRTHSHCAP